MNDRVATSIRWVVWSRGFVQVVSFASTLVVARLLTPEDYGVMALALMWTQMTSLVAELGLGAAILQYRDLDARELNTCFWLILALALLGYAALYAGAPAIAAWFEHPMIAPVLRIAGLTLPLTALRTVPETLLRKDLNLDKVSKAEIAASVMAIPMVLGIAWSGGGVWALVAGVLTIAVIQTIVVFWFAAWSPGIRVGGSRVPAMVRYSVAWLGARLCWSAYHHADTFVLGKIAGGAGLGLYSMARQLALLPIDKISPMVNQIASPVMAELQGDRRAMGATLMRGLRLMAWVTLPMCVGLAVVAEDLIHLLLTAKWAPAVPIVQVLCAYTATRALALLFPTALMAQYRARFVFTYNAVLLGVMPVAFWIGAQWAGGIGVAAAWAVIHPIVMIWIAREVLRGVDLSWKHFSIELGRPLGASVLMVAAMVTTNWALASWEGPVRLATTTLVGAIAYAAALWQLGSSVHGEIVEMTGCVFGRSPLRACPAAR